MQDVRRRYAHVLGASVYKVLCRSSPMRDIRRLFLPLVLRATKQLCENASPLCYVVPAENDKVACSVV